MAIKFFKNQDYPYLLWVSMLIISLTSLWIRMNFPIFAIGSARFDDLLFVRQAAEIGMGHWLGNYDNLTHAKGIGYSLFMLLNHATGLPLKFSEHAVFLCTSAFFSITIGQLYQSRILITISFILLAFMPVAWTAGEGGRVVREGLYISQALMLITLAIRCFATPSPKCVRKQLRAQRLALVLFGFVGGWFWITREESIWLLPAITVLIAYWLLRQVNWHQQWAVILGFICIPFMIACLIVGSVNLANYLVYGVFLNNDFRSKDYQAGYGALTRIRHDNWQRYVLFPKDARERAYEMSAAARELKPYFEGVGGEFWRKAGCNQTQTTQCSEILSGWFMWALRDSVASAGHYSNASNARIFYRRLAQEINEGCTRKPNYCLSKRESLIPPWRDEYALDALKASLDVFKTLSTFGNMVPNIHPSEGDQKYLALFDMVTNGPLAPTAGFQGAWGINTLHSPRDEYRLKIAQQLTCWIRPLFHYGLPLSFFGWVLWSIVVLIRIVKQKQCRIPSAAWWVATSLAVAVTTRVVLLGFLEATSIPSNNMLYLFPVVPIALAMLPVVLWGIARFFRKTANSAQTGVVALQGLPVNASTDH